MSLLHATKKQGFGPPKTAHERKAYRDEKAARRAKNVVNAREILARNGIEYQETQLQPDGTLFVIHEPRAIWYYPADGRWYAKGEPVHFGARNLVRFVNGMVI